MQNPFLPAVQISFDLRIGKEKIPDKGPALEQLIPYLQYHWQSGPCIINFAWIPEENQYEKIRLLENLLFPLYRSSKLEGTRFFY